MSESDRLMFLASAPSKQQSYDVQFDENKNLFFIASNVERVTHGVNNHDNILVAVNELNTEKELFHVQKWLDDGKNVFLDSGVFNLTNEHMKKHSVSMDVALGLAPEQIDGFDDLFDKYVSISQRFSGQLWGCIELDQGGRENKIRTRKRLEDLGIDVVPVYHPLNDGWDYFDYLAERYDKICFGNVVQASRATRQRLVATAWQRKRKYPNLWIHLLGLTANEWLYAMPINSCDSSSWLSPVRWSGQNTFACGKNFGGMPKDFQYKLGSDPTSPQGSRKATSLSAYSTKLLQLNWNNHINRMKEMGFDL